MPTSKKAKGYSASDMREVSDNPEWTKKDFDRAKKFSDVFPELAATIRRRGPGKKPAKELVSIRLSQDVLSHYRAKGTGWQTKIDEDLRKIAKAAGR
jgi:uncharacterized protein (DUF4415 family)